MNYLVETEIECPACGEWFPITVDTSQGDYDTVEDCSVCCRPMSVEVRCSPGQVDSAETTAARGEDFPSSPGHSFSSHHPRHRK